MNKLQKALEFSKAAHAGQVDKAGKDYFAGHITTVVNSCKTQLEKTVAALHDVVEDTEITLDDVKREFGDVVAEAVDCITWRKDEKYFVYIHRLNQNKIARHVKIADLTNNLDATRLPNYPNLTEKEKERLNTYQVALEYVTAIEKEQKKKSL